MNAIRRLIAALAVCTVAAACSQQSTPALPPQGVIALSDQFTGEFALVDKNGEQVTQADFAGKVMLVYFGFTLCPDVCPGDINVMSAALNELGEDAEDVAAVFISVDPERDTPQALGDYFAFDERIRALTGSVEAARAARMAYKVVAQKQPLPDSALEYTVQHNRFFYINDRNGRPKLAVVGGVSPQELAAVLQRTIAENPSAG